MWYINLDLSGKVRATLVCVCHLFPWRHYEWYHLCPRPLIAHIPRLPLVTKPSASLGLINLWWSFPPTIRFEDVGWSYMGRIFKGPSEVVCFRLKLIKPLILAVKSFRKGINLGLIRLGSCRAHAVLRLAKVSIIMTRINNCYAHTNHRKLDIDYCPNSIDPEQSVF